MLLTRCRQKGREKTGIYRIDNVEENDIQESKRAMVKAARKIKVRKLANKL